MSKYSPKEALTKKIENSQEEILNGDMLMDDNLTTEQMADLDPALFEAAAVDDAAAERTGYSDYSYWGSTVRMFLKNKVAVANLIIMLVLVLFTFIQPLLPNQFDPNYVNYYDSKAVWYLIEEDGTAQMDGIKYTKGDYAVDVKEGQTLAYIQAPSSWGKPVALARNENGKEFELEVAADPNNSGWYYCVVKESAPFVYFMSEDRSVSTYYDAVWLSVEGEKNAVYTYGVKKTEGALIDSVPDGQRLVYVSVPAAWGTPKLTAASSVTATDGEKISMSPVDGNDGWFYAFYPEEKTALSLASEDGKAKGMNKVLLTSGQPSECKCLTGFIENRKPNKIYWFGTNDIGQDLWSRMWSGTRTSLFIGIIVALIEAVVGIIAGLIWGYVRKLDFLFTEIYNLINNIPSTIILVLASYIMRPGIKTIIIAMSITGWIGLARFIRNQVLIIRDRDFNLASRCLGTPLKRVITRNLLPQMVSVVMLRMALAIPGAIGSEVFLSYIGLGLPIKTPSLGNLVNKGRTLMMAPTMRYQLFIPAIILSIITVCFYLVGNAFSDAADPKNHV